MRPIRQGHEGEETPVIVCGGIGVGVDTEPRLYFGASRVIISTLVSKVGN